MTDALPDIRIRIWGLRRSGNHAIISWLMASVSKDKRIFFNNCQLGKPARNHFAQLDDGSRVWTARQMRRGMISPETLERAAATRTAFVSYEDALLSRALARRQEMTPDFTEGFHKEVVVTRSFLNWLASFWKLLPRIGYESGTAEANAEAFRMIALWKANDRHVRSKAFQVDPGAVRIHYDSWMHDAESRRLAYQKLALPGPVPPMPDVATYGSGSSFDGLTFQGRAGEMTVSSRWEQALTDPGYVQVLRLALQDKILAARVAEETPEAVSALSERSQIRLANVEETAQC